jgi:drug/metabolite transporter (DMT)-like permease
MRGGRLLGAVLVALGATLWGGWALVVRPSGLPAVQVALVSMMVMAAPLPFVVRAAPFRDRRAVAALLLLGLADAGSVGLLFAALERGPVAVAVLTHYLAPILVTLAGPLLLGEPGSRRARLAAPASLLGLALLVWRPGEGGVLVTAALGATSAVFYAVFVFAARGAGRAFSPPALVSLHALVSGGVLLLLFGGAAIPAPGPGALHAVIGSVVCGSLGTMLFFKGVTMVPSAVTGAIAYLEPLTAALLGWVVFGEAVDAMGLAGAALMLASGVAMATEPERRPEAPRDAAAASR